MPDLWVVAPLVSILWIKDGSPLMKSPCVAREAASLAWIDTQCESSSEGEPEPAGIKIGRGPGRTLSNETADRKARSKEKACASYGLR